MSRGMVLYMKEIQRILFKLVDKQCILTLLQVYREGVGVPPLYIDSFVQHALLYYIVIFINMVYSMLYEFIFIISYVFILACLMCSFLACLMCSFLACLMCRFFACLMFSFLAWLMCSFLACLVCSFLACLVCSSSATSSPLKRLASLASLTDLLRHVALCTGG